ncbi:MAG: ABC transporter permease, partial [Candidatus Puniceispirillaceae bacterium]
ESLAPISAALPIRSRYLKSTTLVVRNLEQLDALDAGLPTDILGRSEAAQLTGAINQTRQLISLLSDPQFTSDATMASFADIEQRLGGLTAQLGEGPGGASVSPDALTQPKWGTGEVEIPMLPMTPRGVMFDAVSQQIVAISDDFLAIRNMSPEAEALIASTAAAIATVKKAEPERRLDEAGQKERKAFIKAVERIFKRIDDATIFPAESMAGINLAVGGLNDAVDRAKGGLGIVESLFFPGQGIVKSRTQCTEQGSGRWLPKPSDVVATFATLANPDLDSGGGYKGTRLLWWKWLPVADVVGFLIPDALVDMMPGGYGTHGTDGSFIPTYKDRMLAFARGDVYLGSIPMLDGHIWDSLFRVLVAMGFGVLLGVPLGIYMGVSRLFKSFFDPMIELYRPVPPLAWAPLILTIFGIQDDGKIFLLFMVAFAIMVISARTGASGTQLSKIRASHSLGATDRQILRHVILPNALPEILTGVRISIGVCWGTLVAAEMLAGTTGIGFIENVARTVSDYELIWVTILIMGMLGLLFDLVMRWVIGRLIPWRGKG